MAALVTANRWNGNLDTHKTAQGPILCTGVGCVVCFPDVRPKETSDFGICDVDQTVYTLRPWLNDSNTKRGRPTSKRRRTRKSKPKVKAGTEEREGKDALGEDFGYEIKVTDAETQTCDSEPSRFVDVKQTKDSTAQIESLRADKATELPSIAEQFLEEMASCGRLNESCTHSDIVRYPENGDVALTGKVYDNIYVGRGRNIALSLRDDCLPSGAFSDWGDCKEPSPKGEDAICFFFALEYYQSVRDLPEFKVMEIVESLSKIVDLEDIRQI